MKSTQNPLLTNTILRTQKNCWYDRCTTSGCKHYGNETLLIVWHLLCMVILLIPLDLSCFHSCYSSHSPPHFNSCHDCNLCIRISQVTCPVYDRRDCRWVSIRGLGPRADVDVGHHVRVTFSLLLIVLPEVMDIDLVKYSYLLDTNIPSNGLIMHLDDS
jgi:hypothetical protein